MSDEQNIHEEKLENENILPVQKAGSEEQTIEPLTSDLESQTENMEVHHHPDLHHRKKHWKEYFLEFLMIFLAVTMGVFAESYREYLGERAKEKEYMQSTLKDLKADTLNLNLIILANASVTRDCNSLIDIFSKEINTHETIINAYALYEKSTLTAYNAILSEGNFIPIEKQRWF